MPDYADKHAEFSRRLDELAQQRGSSELPGDVQERLQAWEARLDQRLAEHRGVSPGKPAAGTLPAEPAPEPPPPQVRPGGALEAWLAGLDGMLLSELGLGRYPLPAGLACPPLLLPDEAALRQAALGAGLTLPVKATPPVLHLPGVGTLVVRGRLPAGNATPLARAQFVAALARQRWGWGYLLEYTALGQQAVAAGLFPALASRHLGLAASPGPVLARAEAVSEAWTLLAAGWQDWVEQFVLFKSRHAAAAGVEAGQLSRPRPDRLLELVQRVFNLFPLYIFVDGVRVRLVNLVDLVRFLFLEENDALTQGAHQLLLQAGALCRAGDPTADELTGYSLSQVLGMFYFARLESCVGIRAVPYAVLVAAHLPWLDLRQGAAQIRAAFEAAPRQHPDTRLALLSGLDSRVKYDPAAMYTAAWERLRLDGPQEYFV